MSKRRLIWHLFPSYFLIIILSVFAVTWYFTFAVKKFYLNETSRELQARAVLIRDNLLEKDIISNPSAVDSLCKRLGKASTTRVTVILPSGKVIGDSDDDPALMENHSNRPEIKEAFAGRVGIATRYSFTLSETMMYAAEPVAVDDSIIAVVRTSLPITAIDHTFGQIYPKIIVGGLIMILLAGIAGYYVSRRIAIPLEKMRLVANRYSSGNFQHSIPFSGTAEIDDLANALNQMARELDEKIRVEISRRNELETVLSSMLEGVMAFDTDERLISINDAATKMIGVDKRKIVGLYVQEAIRNIHLQRFIRNIMTDDISIASEINIQGDNNRTLQVHGTRLKDEKGNILGALVVLSDITVLRRLENMRRDFVSNVSHELRTPITSIKGFVETLREGAINSPPDAERFLDIISKQADRLNSIISDLLVLSKIEEAEKTEIELEYSDIKDILQNSIEACGAKAKAKEITVNLNCDIDLKARINPNLIEQAVINLLDNAIKYSNQKGIIEISCMASGGKLEIRVRDEGCGIEKKHLSRLFERFYRVDTSRSRELGGTGLGLAIVKHIVQAHRGQVAVESTPGQGSTFKISLPY